MNMTMDQERRTSPRLPVTQRAQIHALDRLGRVVAMLEDATIINVSSGGLAVCSKMGVSEDMLLRVQPVDEETSFEVKVLSNLPMPDRPSQFMLRCKLTVGQIPASMIID